MPIATGGTVTIQYGSVSMNGTTASVSFPISFATACTAVAITATALDGSGHAMFASSVSTAGFTVNSSGTATATVYWMAMGY
jgi:plasmid replication initiation protein